jgi:predicted flavoprotein YhiN
MCRLGHSIVQPVPSLFSFKTALFSVDDLAGISIPMVKVR